VVEMSIGDTTRKITAKNKFLDELTDKKPSEQMHFWINFYKPIFIPIIPSIIIGALMKYTGKYSDFEVGVMIILIFISVSVNKCSRFLSQINDAKKINGDVNAETIRI
jgi:hypothetical protein